MPVRNMRHCAALLLALLCAVSAQIAWTPIFLDGSSQVDLWTQSSSGCACPGDGGDDCACCVRDGACPCGEVAPTRTNEEIDGQIIPQVVELLFNTDKLCDSMRMWKSLTFRASIFRTASRIPRQSAWYLRCATLPLIPGFSEANPGRLLDKSSLLQSKVLDTALTYCSLMRDNALRSKFTDYFLLEDSMVQVVLAAGFNLVVLVLYRMLVVQRKPDSVEPMRGTLHQWFSLLIMEPQYWTLDCDWLYQDVSCRSAPCVLASPGYPGLYPPHRRCRYLLATNSVHTRVKIIFTSIILPRNHCSSDYLTLRAGSSPSAPLLASICSERSATLEQPGPNLLLEFNSGPLVPPYDYNGFIARLEFQEKIKPSGPPPTVLAASEPLAALTHHTHHGDKLAIENDVISNEISSNGRVGCGATVRGYGAGGARSGHFDTRSSAWRTQCAIHLLGTPADVVQVSLFNYNLRLQSCRSHIEILEGLHDFGNRVDRSERYERGDRALLRVCGPSVREARDPSGRFLVRQAVTSKGANLTILIRRAASQSADEEEFVDGAFAFHDEQHEGTVSPDATCASTHYGLAAPPHGGVSAPAHHHVFWNIEERLLCTHRFIPAANQSVTIEIQRLERMWSAEPTSLVVPGASGCRTACGDAGCECRSATPLHYHDHIALVAGDGTHLSCLCGDFQSAWLPVVVRSWTSLRLEYSVAHYTYASRGFDYAAAYSFNDDAMCGQRTYTVHSGEISSRNVSVTGSLNEFFYQQCTWVLDSNVERQVFIDISSEQDKSCSSWNITIHEWSGRGVHTDGGLAATAGDLLYTFCARNKNQTYTLPWRLNTVVIRLVALSRQQPLYTIRWRSQVVRANTRLGPPTPAPAASAMAGHITVNIIKVLIVLLILCENI
ncbi:uncharacterized protein LOC126980044 [Leptidea sinapis]|uniref:uncharacterized protein LOC126980044 n=1 Tax=Leptidea sinapis TaxID=189913 RepID=UPI0021C3C6D8|nr:uncharacterized protein LOC126980044 [Leptidea sinapis]